MSAKVWVLGDAVVDLLPESDGRLLPCPGGAPANVAVGIARLGGTSGFIGRVGDDPFGALMQRTLLTEGVDITYLKQDEWHRTSTVLVDLNDQGERSFTFMVRPSADLFLETTDLPCWRHGEWLHLCSIALSAEPSRTSAFTAMTEIRHAGGFVSFDPNIREDLWQDEHLLRLCLRQALQLADVVKLSEEEWRLISGKTQNDRDICALAKEYEIAMLLVTKGAEGWWSVIEDKFTILLECLWIVSIARGREMRSLPGYSQVCPLRDYLQMREKCDELSISLNVAERLQ